MIRKTVIAAGIGTLVLLGAAGTAFAAESDATPTTPAPAATPGSAGHTTGRAHHQHAHRTFRGEYGTWTTFDAKTDAATVHDAIRGTVGAVSSSSITLKAADGTSQTYAVDAGTKVHAKGDTKTDPGAIGQVKVGDRAVVLGTGQGTPTATHVRDHGVAPTPTP